MRRWALSGIGGLVLLPVLVIGAAVGALSGIGVADPSPTAIAAIPPAYLQLYMDAGSAYGIPWQVLAGIGKVECDHGQDPDPACWKQGAVNSAGAGGPMQFLASTWASYGVDADGNGPPDRWDPADAIYAAADYLRASGAPQDMDSAIYAYNHSASYVQEVLHWAALYQGQTASEVAVAPSGVATRAVAFALGALGVPYVYGGESPSGYDCSGLVQAAYRAAGIILPRVAQDQYDAGPHLAPGTPLAPGDLVFFGESTTDVQHVGIVVHGDLMVDAPHTGAVVRTEQFPTAIGASWGSELYLGATRPAAGTSQ